MRDNYYIHLIIVFLVLLVTVNLVILDLKVFSGENNIRVAQMATEISPVPTNASLDLCPASCLNIINAATAAGRIGTMEQNNQPTQQAKTLQTKEFFIPLGNGTTQKNYWDDLTATETVIDPANYGIIKEAYFTASLRNPTQNGQVEVQLYNVTDKYPVWGTHIIMNGPASQTINSEKFAMPQGNKLYRVQMKSTLLAPSYLDNAKIRIIVE